ncbi:MAG TPA: hypothetical protein DEA08_13980 [Planctomycetes bacterium]|nr:hypothetical protein [Planctomycetota bacterium]
MALAAGCNSTSGPQAGGESIAPATEQAMTVRVDVQDAGQPALRGTLWVAPELRERVLVRLSDDAEPTLR